MPRRSYVATIIEVIIALLPSQKRYGAYLSLFRHCAAVSVARLFSVKDEHLFEQRAEELSHELEALVGRIAEHAPVSGSHARAADIMKLLLRLDNHLYKAISLHASAYDDGVHPKHRLMKYHDFFCRNVGPNESVLDIGCGNGFLTSDIAKCTSSRVVGIDMNSGNIDFAKKHYQRENIEFICGDISASLERSSFDVIVLSNVLEHLPDRPDFLKRVRETANPTKFLIRVPLYEREWMVPLKKELGINYLLDSGHRTEYTQEEFFEELRKAGLYPVSWEIRWGEMWCRAVPDERQSAASQVDGK